MFISVLYESNLFHFILQVKFEARVEEFINIGKKQVISIHNLKNFT